jgi:hypothetical protein
MEGRQVKRSWRSGWSGAWRGSRLGASGGAAGSAQEAAGRRSAGQTREGPLRARVEWPLRSRVEGRKTAEVCVEGRRVRRRRLPGGARRVRRGRGRCGLACKGGRRGCRRSWRGGRRAVQVAWTRCAGEACHGAGVQIHGFGDPV